MHNGGVWFFLKWHPVTRIKLNPLSHTVIILDWCSLPQVPCPPLWSRALEWSRFSQILCTVNIPAWSKIIGVSRILLDPMLWNMTRRVCHLRDGMGWDLLWDLPIIQLTVKSPTVFFWDDIQLLQQVAIEGHRCQTHIYYIIITHDETNTFR